MDPAEDPPPDPLTDPRVFQAIQDYQAEIDAGRRPDRAEFVSRYPDVAEEVAGCLDGFDFLRAASPRATHGHSGTATLAAESRLGEFRLLREVGRGGMGVVYEAEQPSLGRRVALKVVAAPALDDRTRQRFRNEAHAAASLRHPHIVPVYAVGAEGESLFLAMQFVGGRSLAAVVRQLQCPTDPAAETAPNTAADTGPYTPPTPEEKAEPLPFPAPPAAGYYRATARLAADAADALRHAHDLGIVHRDVKPGNLLVEPTGHLWVADFGLARLPDSGDLTRTGEMLGTLRYMSPEQVAGAAVDHRTDVYSLGATLYELLTLHPAFPGSDPHDVLRRIASAEPPAPRALAPSVPRDLETVVLKAMAKDPAERYPTARALADDLTRFLEDRPVLARRPSLAHRVRKWGKRNRGLVAAGLAGVILLLASTAVVLAVGADRIRAEQRRTETANAELTDKNTELDQTVGALNRSTTDLNRANADLTAALRQARQAEYTFKFLAARREWLEGNVRRADDLLADCPAECRGWEWAYMRRLTRAGPLATLALDPATAGQIAFSPDGTRFVALGREAVAVWEVPRAGYTPTAPLATRRFGPQIYHSLQYSADGSRLRVLYRQSVQTWDAETLGFLKQQALPGGPVVGGPVALSPDGSRVLCRSGKELLVAETATGAVIRALTEASPDTGADPVWVGTSDRVLVRSARAGLQVFDATTGQSVLTIRVPEKVGRIAVGPTGTFYAGVVAGEPVRVGELVADNPPALLSAGAGTKTAVGFAPDGRRVAITGTTGFGVWDARTGWELASYRWQFTFPPVVEFHPDGRRLATRNGTELCFWDATTSQEGRALPGVRLMKFSDAILIPESGRVVRAGNSVQEDGDPAGIVELIDATDGRLVRTTRGPADRNAVAVRGGPPGYPDGLLLHPEEGGAWSVRDHATGTTLGRVPGPIPPTLHLAILSAGGRSLALARFNEPQVRLIDLPTGKETALPVPLNSRSGMWVRGLAFHPKGHQIATGDGAGQVTVWDVRTGAPLFRIPAHANRVGQIAYDPSGKVFGTAGADGPVKLWDAETGAPVGTLNAHRGPQTALAFSPDGSRIATAGERTPLQIWDAQSGQEYLVIANPTSAVSLAFDPSGRFLLSNDLGGQVTAWDAAEAPAALRHTQMANRAARWHDARARTSEVNPRDGLTAIWHLERLLELEPSDDGARARLAKVRTRLAGPPPKR